jgi:hypothetical protein
VGITKLPNEGVFVNGGAKAGDEAHFFSDNPGKTVAFIAEGSKLQLVDKPVDTAPVLSNGSAMRTSAATATVRFTSDKAGTYYYRLGGEAPDPTALTGGTGTAMAGGENTAYLTGLADGAQ